MDFIRNTLFSLQDTAYGDFVAKLIPTIDRDKIIGVRSPQFKTLIKKLEKDPMSLEFLEKLPHKYYEENSLHGYILGTLISDVNEVLSKLEIFLPHIDNWATCDGTVSALKLFAKYPNEVAEKVNVWLTSDKTYTVRFAVVTLMNYFLNEHFDESIVDKLCLLKGGDYYIDMAVAWYFATALTKQYPTAIAVIKHKRLPVWTHNKAIQKACESFRITEETKNYLKTLKISKGKK